MFVGGAFNYTELIPSPFDAERAAERAGEDIAPKWAINTAFESNGVGERIGGGCNLDDP